VDYSSYKTSLCETLRGELLVVDIFWGDTLM